MSRKCGTDACMGRVLLVRAVADSARIGARVTNFLAASVAAVPGLQMVILFAVVPTPTIKPDHPRRGTGRFHPCDLFQSIGRADGPLINEARALFKQDMPSASKQRNRPDMALSTAAIVTANGATPLNASTSAAAAALPPLQTASGPEQGRASKIGARPEHVRRQVLSAAVTGYLRAKGPFMSESSVRTFIMRTGELANRG